MKLKIHSTMAQVLKITKPDKTVHVVPLENKASLQSYNNRQPSNMKWKIEEIDESEAEKLPFIDEKYVTGAEAVEKNAELEKKVQSQDEIIAQLRKQLAEKQPGSKNDTDTEQLNATEVIAKIEKAKTVAEVDSLIEGDERKTVLAAAEKKKNSFN